jgi:hypothetical protein
VESRKNESKRRVSPSHTKMLARDGNIGTTLASLWLLLALYGSLPHECLAMRRHDDMRSTGSSSSSSSSFSRLGSLPLSTESLAFWRSGNNRPRHRSPNSQTVFPDEYHGLTLPTARSLREEEHTDMAAVRPVSLARNVRRRSDAKQQQQSSSPDDDSVAATSSGTSSVELAMQLTRPLIPQDAWDAATGFEFQDPELVEALAQSGLELCQAQGDENPNVAWVPHSSTQKLLDEHGDDPLRALLEESSKSKNTVLVYAGKIKKEGVVGSKLPLVKTQSILPLAAEEMADLLMDSSRVTIYNKMSMGRKDLRLLNPNTKIVRNLTQPPVAKSKMVTVTLMHSRPLTDTDPLKDDTPYKRGYLVVSRAVPGMIDEDMANLPRNEILLGVNLLQEISPDECLMTAVTHVYSPSLPAMLARSIGIKSAVDFVRDIRASCQLVGAN